MDIVSFNVLRSDWDDSPLYGVLCTDMNDRCSHTGGTMKRNPNVDNDFFQITCNHFKPSGLGAKSSCWGRFKFVRLSVCSD